MELLKNSVNSKSISTNKTLDRSIFGENMEYLLDNFNRSNQDTCLLHKPSVQEGQWVQSGDLLADCASSVGGELSLGQNLLIAYMPWEGYNYEDAILISERLVYDDLYTSVHIEKYETETRETKLGIEEITREIPEISEKEIYHLDKNGIAKIGSWVEEGDILVGKTTPINKKELSSYQKLLYTILEKEYVPVRDSSLRAPKGIRAKIVKIEVFLNKGSTPYPYSAKSEYSYPQKGSSIKNISNKMSNTQGKKKINLALSNNLIRASQKNHALGGTTALSIKGETSFIGRWLTKEMLGKVTKGKTRKVKNVKSLSNIKNLTILSGNNVLSNGSNHYRDKIGSTQNLKSINLKTRPMGEAFGLFLNKTSPPLASLSPSESLAAPLGIGGENLKILNLHLSKKTEVLNFEKFKGESKLALQKLLKMGEIQLNHFLFDQRSILLSKSFESNSLGISGNKNISKSDIGLRNSPQRMGIFSKLGANPSKSLNKTIKGIRTLGETKAININGPLSNGKVKGLITKISKPPKQTSKQISSKDSALWTINLYLAEKRKVQVGDKLAGRHGNKGIISMILPREDMPYLPDGTPIDMVLNPLGVPSRMNVGQIYECLLGLAGKYLGENYKVFPFDEIYGPEASRSFVYSKLNEARVKTGLSWLFEPSTPGKIRLYDGRTGDCFDQASTVGIAYILRLVHMVDDKIHCLTPDHEVLTTTGWVPINKITTDHEVATLQKGTGELVYQNPTEVYHYPHYEGSMYLLKNANIDLFVTLNHRMFVKNERKTDQYFDSYELIEASQIVGKHKKYLKNAKNTAPDYQFILPPVHSFEIHAEISEKAVNMSAWLTFFGIWIAEGWADNNIVSGSISNNQKDIYTVTVAQNKVHVIKVIHDAILSLGYNFNINNEKICINNKQLCIYLQPLSVGAPKKFLPDWVWLLSQSQAQELLHAMCLGDGTLRGTSLSYYTSSNKLADDVMRLALHAGWSANKYLHIEPNTVDGTINGQQIISEKRWGVWQLSIIKGKNDPAVNDGHHKNQNVQKEEIIKSYVGSVHCIGVPNQVFYVRRNGLPVWTGNSRSTGPYSLVTQQPLRGRSKQGGQRLGEMEVWAIEGYGAAFTLLEMLTIKSDDMTGRMTLWSNLILNKDISIGTPESFKVLVCELQALCLDIGLFRMSNFVTNAKEKALPQVNQNMYPLDQNNTVNTKESLIELENLMNLP